MSCLVMLWPVISHLWHTSDKCTVHHAAAAPHARQSDACNSGGDAHLGGDDWDAAIVRWLVDTHLAPAGMVWHLCMTCMYIENGPHAGELAMCCRCPLHACAACHGCQCKCGACETTVQLSAASTMHPYSQQYLVCDTTCE